MPRSRIPLACFGVFLVVWTALAIAPVYRDDWVLENLLVFLGVPVAILSYRWFRLSDRAYAQVTIFAILHTIGSHYTYAEVPAGFWLQDLLGLDRNHYDRIVHFTFGLLLLRPLRELAFRSGHPSPLAELYLSLAAVGWWSGLYEIVEGVTARIADPAAGTAYLGTQGDEWDAQKDMACALAGAFLAGLLEWSVDRVRGNTG